MLPLTDGLTLELRVEVTFSLVSHFCLSTEEGQQHPSQASALL